MLATAVFFFIPFVLIILGSFMAPVMVSVLVDLWGLLLAEA